MRRYRRDIDGLRSIAVLPVVLFHAGVTWFKGGFVGVDIFFVISGYLISSILIEEKAQGRYSIIAFYERRVRRILPALFVVLAACLPLAWMLILPDQLMSFGGALAAVVTYVSNMWFWKATNYFSPVADENPLLHTWSLSVEEQFYVIFPLALMVLWRFGRRWMFWLFAAAFGVSLLGAELGSVRNPTANFYILPSRAWELLAGTLVAFLHARPDAMAGVKPLMRNLLSLAGFALVLVSILFYDGDLPYPGLYTLAPILGASLILYAGDDDTTWVGKLLCLKPLVWCGLISYSLYLWHQPVFAFARLASVEELEPWVFWVLIAVAMGLAVLSYRFVERPFRDKNRFSRRTVFIAAAICTLIFLAISGVFYYGKGLTFRMTAAERREEAEIQRQIDLRTEAVMTSTCHYSNVVVKDFEGFIRQWSCAPPPSPEGRLFVVGDSHAADIAMALRAAGADIGQITGAGCTIRWSDMPARCRRMFNQLITKADFQPSDTIILTQRWRQNANLAGFDKDLERWKRRGAKVIMIGPRGEFPNFYRRALVSANRGGRERLANVKAVSAINPKQLPVMERAARRTGTPLIKIDDLFCNLSPATSWCGAVEGQQYLVLDDTHFTTEAAARLGPGLLKRIRDARPAPALPRTASPPPAPGPGAPKG